MPDLRCQLYYNTPVLKIRSLHKKSRPGGGACRCLASPQISEVHRAFLASDASPLALVHYGAFEAALNRLRRCAARDAPGSSIRCPGPYITCCCICRSLATGTTCTQRATSSSLDCTPAHRTSVLRGSRRTSVHFPVPPAKVNGPVFCSTPNALGLFLGCGCTTAISHRLVTAPNNSEFRAKDWSCPTSNCSRPVLYVCCCCHSHVPLIVCASRS